MKIRLLKLQKNASILFYTRFFTPRIERGEGYKILEEFRPKWTVAEIIEILPIFGLPLTQV